ncbi:MAG: RpiB/LacA/LacB family sugar-phosphate isomerase [Bacilli bacterium]|nr:RpiB/LacA/LacB family sugar-phosphate isomerase [Bacilli bacterium]
MKKIKLGFASDHRGYELKEKLINYMKKQEDIIDITDCGTNSIESCDYPDFAYLLGKELQSGGVDFGISICGSGIGISIAMNKMKGVYCAKVNNALEASYTRLDNNTNCVAFSSNTSLPEAIKIIDTFIHTEFSNLERHQKRIDKVKKIEEELYD